MRDCFSGYHPTVNFFYFACVLLFSMFFMHPVCLGISLVSALAYSVYLNGRRAIVFNVKFMLPLLLLTALLNPAFNHAGVTILTYLPNGNPITLEAVLYGIAAAVMLVTVIGWFSCYNTVMTSDKFTYLFVFIVDFFHDTALCPQIQGAVSRGFQCPALYRQRCEQRRFVSKAAPWGDHCFYHGDVGVGKCY